jgi:hypothetical protein
MTSKLPAHAEALLVEANEGALVVIAVMDDDLQKMVVSIVPPAGGPRVQAMGLAIMAQTLLATIVDYLDRPEASGIDPVLQQQIRLAYAAMPSPEDD